MKVQPANLHTVTQVGVEVWAGRTMWGGGNEALHAHCLICFRSPGSRGRCASIWRSDSRQGFLLGSPSGLVVGNCLGFQQLHLGLCVL